MCGPYTCIPTQFHPQFRYPYKGSNDIKNIRILYCQNKLKVALKLYKNTMNMIKTK